MLLQKNRFSTPFANGGSFENAGFLWGGGYGLMVPPSLREDTLDEEMRLPNRPLNTHLQYKQQPWTTHQQTS